MLTLNDFISVVSLIFTVFGVAYSMGKESTKK